MPLRSTRRWSTLSKAILARDGGVCALCGAGGATTVDHIIPRSRGGGDEEWNLRAAHRVCNSRRGNMTSLPRANVSRW